MRRLYATARWRRVRAEVLQRDQHRCTECGAVGGADPLEVHHVDGWRGGFWAEENLRTLCRRCHLEEHGRAEVPGRRAWLEEVARLVREPPSGEQL